MSVEKSKAEIHIIGRNRRASFEFHLMDRFEAGLVLQGTEVKSLRQGRADLTDSFARIEGEELFLHHLDIPIYSHGTYSNHEPKRRRKLLLHRREILKLKGRVHERGLTLIPTQIYFKGNYAKIEIAVAKGKTHGDKRQDLKRKEHLQEMARYRSR
ncbi:MAG: SsrA-binding protein SmpB [Planctomycetes bacterium]|nr:SsrA-binding protein SmpB [Planctomycetota bacterium]